jgi:NTE family protein
MTSKKKKAIVLSGGGAKGAYEAGVLKYIIENWGFQFDIVVGTSAGALNSFMYSNLDQTLTNETNAKKMVLPWEEVKFKDVLKIPFDDYISAKFNTVFDNRQLKDFVKKYFNKEIQNSNIKNSKIESLIVTTGELTSGTAHVWYVTNNPNITVSSERWRSHKMKEFNEDYAVASGAIPCIFRAVELEDEKGRKEWHNDGGVTMNTPISPAIQAGAEKILVLYLGNPNKKPAQQLPNIFQILNGTAFTILYSHLKEDIIRANTINYLLDKLGVDTFENYRKVSLLTLRPEIDLDEKTASIIKDTNHITRWFIPNFIFKTLSSTGLFMNNNYTKILIEIGYRDARINHDELEKFFID